MVQVGQGYFCEFVGPEKPDVRLGFLEIVTGDGHELGRPVKGFIFGVVVESPDYGVELWKGLVVEGD